MSMLPTLETTTYRAMYAFGNHLHVSSGEEHLTTRDSGVFAHYGDLIWMSQRQFLMYSLNKRKEKK